MAKVDIEGAYRLISVHVLDRLLLGIWWKGSLFVDPMLPFGLRLAPKILNATTDTIQWHVEREGVEHIDHYLDDFIVLRSSGSSQCQQALDTVVRVCTQLGIPLATHKIVSPSTCLTFLGISIETCANELRLPPDKLTRLKCLLAVWGDLKACSERELESRTGTLNHVCKVVGPGWSFLTRMLNLLRGSHVRCTGRRLTQHIHLKCEFSLDLLWWSVFAKQWN